MVFLPTQASKLRLFPFFVIMHLLNKLVRNDPFWTTGTLTAECMLWPLGHYALIEGDLLISSDVVDGALTLSP